MYVRVRERGRESGVVLANAVEVDDVQRRSVLIGEFVESGVRPVASRRTAGLSSDASSASLITQRLLAFGLFERVVFDVEGDDGGLVRAAVEQVVVAELRLHEPGERAAVRRELAVDISSSTRS